MHDPLDLDINPELLRLAQEAALAAALEKSAVVPAGGDPAAAGGMPMAPAARGGAPPMDPSMAGGAPPMDPGQMATAPPADPAMAAAAPPAAPPAAAPAAPAPTGKGKNDQMAADIATVKDMVYKVGLMMTTVAKAMDIEFPPSVMLGQPPATLPPDAAAYANTPPSSPAPGAALDQGGAPPPGAIPPLSGDPTDAGAKSASAEILRLIGEEDAHEEGTFSDWLDAAEKSAEGPASVGAVAPPEESGSAFLHPLQLARALRERNLAAVAARG